jgi:hypothetical protein
MEKTEIDYEPVQFEESKTEMEF